MITKYVVGDITETELGIIAHCVNCQDKMGSGVAKALYEKFPRVKSEYHKYGEYYSSPEKRLGLVQMVLPKLPQEKFVFNCFAQLEFGYDGKRYVNYAALGECFRQIARNEFCKKLAIPKIGCGLAGGDWNIVEQIINDAVGDKVEVWVYELPKSNEDVGN